MIKLKFNRNFKTIELIMNSGKTQMPVHIIDGGLLIYPIDYDPITKILDSQYLKYKS